MRTRTFLQNPSSWTAPSGVVLSWLAPLRIVVLLVSLILLRSGVVQAEERIGDASEVKVKQDYSQLIELNAWLGRKAPTELEETPTIKEVSTTEQVIMTIEIATPRWFTGATQITPFEIPNVISMQRSQFATNMTERRDGVTWSKQRWEITFYPLVSGRVVIPSTPVEVQFSAATNQNIVATLHTPPLSFNALLPDGKLAQDEKWLASSELNTSQEWDVIAQEQSGRDEANSDDKLTVGDAIVRRVNISANNTLSILIPDVLTDQSTAQYESYLTPSQLSDSQTRGRYVSTRAEEQTLILQTGGEVTLPSYTLRWWNTEKQQLETEVIEGKTVIVSHTFASFLAAYGQTILLCLIVTLALVIAFWWIIRCYQTHPLPADLELIKMGVTGKDSQARRLVYKKLRVATGRPSLIDSSYIGHDRTKPIMVEANEARSSGSESGLDIPPENFAEYRFQTQHLTKRLLFLVWRRLTTRLSGESMDSTKNTDKFKIPKALDLD